MQFSAQQIADMLQGTIEGNATVTVSTLSRIEEGVTGSLSFLANPLYTQYLYTTKASIVIVNKDFEAKESVTATLIRVENAQTAFAKLLELYNQIKLNKTGIAPNAHIEPSAIIGEQIYAGAFAYVGENTRIGNGVKIYPQVYIGDNCVIGDNTTLFAGVKIYSETHIGKNCIIHSGTVIGSDGFRFDPQNEGNKKIAQIGNVVIEDDVEIGANCAIDRATLGSTILRKGVKFDNLIHIAHNVEVGENTYIAAHGVIAGSTKVGKNCMFSGQVGIVGHLQIADNTIITAQSGISKSITKPGEVYMGSPAFDANKYRKAYIHFRNLDQLAQRVTILEKKLTD
ncbi:MAG: UDP-3-O-(3-hydroxymyristoyl)glucosamine N-acyltransferase [Hydrotalea flava]|uniref:UDP-3-O-(3-hydroxymyristoyl)glucosamine N-acyltransferase n=1 Tax=Hydrotalea TaxID=1004300 RepID=UPI000941DADC|nr:MULTISPECIES: UDP-3-O-(3-hydroxymyristoyl)glucosamine N-acyltransferase [Hydrotalea]NIM35982.1 UDP-3-O-(3-hydroxymyristoyl)glucosamine N-acyltransferase [Hydrotalea flava]NIM38815.1 UDP-3-O-(3-hydroxymyristoyl)glucosamine N-acyltransferase [Hydrotalea flava]NIN04019.1 UDP-3-O-(3-hydroxymyristoyl)glucosamine N-acyltransferase [Hydrotalea flava]NIN15724.1 UDP-3-O-(3-hydroxymyristoyl)glucosamine N-acyltransferase [Hydrotalea flava]NIO94741.1 UDP-3-O-(3-hydroxymyristoyl)glucosamine N-acyltransf